METQKRTDTASDEQEELSSREDEWDVTPGDVPEQGSLLENARLFLRYAVLAHSVNNAQPWSFQLTDDHIRMSAIRRPGSSLRVRDLYFSLGCAVENLSMAARHFHQPHRVSYVPQGRAAYVNVDLNPDWTFGSGDVMDTFEQLTEDHVCSTELDDRKLSYEHKELIRGVSCEDVVLLNLLEGAGGMGKILKFRAKIHDKLNERQNEQDNSSSGSEEHTGQEQSEDLGFWLRIVHFFQSLFSSGGGKEQDEKDSDSGSSTSSDTYQPPNPLPPAVVLSGWVDGPISWIKCGRVFQRVSLLLGRENVKVQPFHDVMAHSTARDEIERMIDTPQETVPLFLFRVGHVSGEEEKSARLPLEDVLVE